MWVPGVIADQPARLGRVAGRTTYDFKKIKQTKAYSLVLSVPHAGPSPAHTIRVDKSTQAVKLVCQTLLHAGPGTHTKKNDERKLQNRIPNYITENL